MTPREKAIDVLNHGLVSAGLDSFGGSLVTRLARAGLRVVGVCGGCAHHRAGECAYYSVRVDSEDVDCARWEAKQ
jgi:hypothetical protein